MSGSGAEMENIVILDDSDKCQLIMRTIIEDQEPIALDCEGVDDDGNITPGRTLTLLQIGKRDGTIYIIDLIDKGRGKTLLYDGKVKDLLESESIVKVMQRCSKDVQAFGRDYDISIVNIFDTLAAHIIWEQEVQHIVFPKKHSLKCLAEIYLDGVKFPGLDTICDDKPEFWSERPLTEEMLNHTATKITILFPALYDKLNGYIESASKEISTYFHEAIEELRINNIDYKGSKQLKIARVERAIFPLFRNMEERYNWDTPVTDFTEDEIKALRHIRGGGPSWDKCTGIVKNWGKILHDLDNAGKKKNPSTEMANIVILDDTDKCRLIMTTVIEDKEPIALDCEGVQRDDEISPPGRTLTLLQIGKRDGTIYIIDLIEQDRGKTFLHDGKVKDLLESENIVKVMHRCSKDVEAFHRDYDISIRNIFDTLAAHIIWEQDVQHIMFPKKHNLEHMAETYLYDVSFPRLGTICDDNECWRERPLTEEMLNYTATKMQILFPTLYDKLKGYIESASEEISRYFHDAIEELRIYRIDHKGSQQLMITRTERAIFPLFRNMEERYDWDTPVTDFTEDEIKALRHIRCGGPSWENCTGIVKNWEKHVALKDLDDAYKKKDPSTGKIYLYTWDYNRIKRFSWEHPDPTVSARAKELLVMCRKEYNYYKP